MWTCNAQGVFESELLSQFPWLWHGFGSRIANGWPGEYTSAKQTHSDIVQIAEQGSLLGHGDALVSATPGLRVGVRTADCVPLLFVDPIHRVVAAVHAGWRGTTAEIGPKTLQRMQQTFGTDPEEVYAAIGPCISECCFQVGSEVATEFRRWLADAEDRTHIDLVSVNVTQLQDSGVPKSQIDVSGMCTVCDPAQFHSFRRDKEASGRMVAAIEIVGG
jgi:YfiH family protein